MKRNEYYFDIYSFFDQRDILYKTFDIQFFIEDMIINM